jgi:hypothetical protein
MSAEMVEVAGSPSRLFCRNVKSSRHINRSARWSRKMGYCLKAYRRSYWYTCNYYCVRSVSFRYPCLPFDTTDDLDPGLSVHFLSCCIQSLFPSAITIPRPQDCSYHSALLHQISSQWPTPFQQHQTTRKIWRHRSRCSERIVS